MWLSEVKIVTFPSISLSPTLTHKHIQTHAHTQMHTHTIPGFHAGQNREAETSFKLLCSCLLGIKGHYSPRQHSHHISTITLLGTAPGHTKQPVAYNGVIVSGDCIHCHPCHRIYSPSSHIVTFTSDPRLPSHVLWH